MTILPLTYLGNIYYFTKLLTEECVIDVNENYVKQSYRNRCDIMSANGPMSLTVNVVKGGSRAKKAVKDMRIDYSERWQHRNKTAIMSAYRNSPYFDHYEEQFAPFYERRYEFLADYNLELLELCLKLLGVDINIKLSETYIIPDKLDKDLRGAFMPVKRTEGILQKPECGLLVPESDDTDLISFLGSVQPYYQVFSDRFPFCPNMSVIDLIFCEGPHAVETLNSRKI